MNMLSRAIVDLWYSTKRHMTSRVWERRYPVQDLEQLHKAWPLSIGGYVMLYQHAVWVEPYGERGGTHIPLGC